ncbi:MAG TPA: ferritin family protein [Selenomonadales bacterium]|nr:ferritin family protein [Selenomonadales bacterium]
MQNLFSDLEGLRIAVEIEVRGREFYRQAAEQAAKDEHRELFQWLADEECTHEAKFAGILSQISACKEAHSDEYLFDADTSRYLTVIADHHVFPKAADAKAAIAELKTVGAILRTALQAEKDSVLFYDELARNAKFDAAKEVFALLKAEEQAHVVKIRQMLDIWA